jgi:hypothetical protein
MAADDALRQRRSRLHAKGNHTLCLPDGCEDAGKIVTASVTREAGLGPTGRALWEQVMAAEKLGPMQRVLLMEACRIADRLDKLETQLTDPESEWLRVEPDYENPTAPVEVVVDKALAESRQQATALKGLIAEIRQASKVASAEPKGDGKPAKQQSRARGGSVVSLADRTTARRNPAAG